MKKLLIIIILFVSSFFLFSIEDVKADTKVLTYSDTVLESIDVDFFTVREAVINYANANSYNYIIRKAAMYQIYFFDNSVTSLFSNGISNFTSPSSFHYFNYDFANGLIEKTNSSSTICPTAALYQLLDTNINLYYTSQTIQINYLDKVYISDTDNKIFSLYDIYLDVNNIEPSNPHQEEIDKLTNFYNMIIEKIEYLAEQISSNYIMLSIIGIFIVTFIFLLIFRRFL